VRALLTAAAVRDDHLIQSPRLPAAAARQVMRSLLNAELAEEVPASVEDAVAVPLIRLGIFLQFQALSRNANLRLVPLIPGLGSESDS
jgi:hypothetical protein